MGNVSNAVKEITEDLNIIYNNHGFGIQFQVGKITVGKDVCSAYSCPDISSLLNSFSDFANSSDFCLHYLFTYRSVLKCETTLPKDLLKRLCLRYCGACLERSCVQRPWPVQATGRSDQEHWLGVIPELWEDTDSAAGGRQSCSRGTGAGLSLNETLIFRLGIILVPCMTPEHKTASLRQPQSWRRLD